MKSLKFSLQSYFYVIFFVLTYVSANAQVGVGTTTPQATLDIVGDPTESAVLDGVIAPRLTGDQLSDKTYTATQTAAVVYVTAADGTPSGQTVNVTNAGYYFFDGTEWIALVQEEDDDFYEVGTSFAAQDITDDIYRTGNVGIGDTTPSYPLDINDLTTTRALNINTTAATAGNIYGVFVNNQNTATGTSTDSKYGMFTRVRVPTGEANKAYGVYNELTGSGGTGDHIGTFNRMIGYEDRDMTGVNNYFTAAGDGAHIGTNNNISSTGSGTHTGTQNQMRGSGIVRGVYNTFNNAAGDGLNRGFENQMTNDGNGTHQGLYNSLSGDGTGQHIGVSNFISGTGNGNHTGVINTLTGSGNGEHVGVYNNINASTGNNWGFRNEIDNTASGMTSYGTYNALIGSDAGGTAIAGYFSSIGSGTNYAAIFANGNVGIGTTTPTEKLEVNGKIKATDINFSGIPTYNRRSDAQADTNLEVGDVYRITRTSDNPNRFLSIKD